MINFIIYKNRGIAHLGICFEEGRGVEVDQSRALELYQEAASRGLPFARMKLTKLCSAEMALQLCEKREEDLRKELNQSRIETALQRARVKKE